MTHPDAPSEAVGAPVIKVRRIVLGTAGASSPSKTLDDLPVALVTADGWLLTVSPDWADPFRAVTGRHLTSTAFDALLGLVRAAGLVEARTAAEEPSRPTPATEIFVTDPETGLSARHWLIAPTEAQRHVLDALGDPITAFGAASVGPIVRYKPQAFRVWAEE